MDRRVGAARSEDPTLPAWTDPRRSRSASPAPSLALYEERPSSEDPERDRHERARGREHTETEQCGPVVASVIARRGEHPDPIEKGQESEPEREDRYDREEHHAAKHRHADIVARSDGFRRRSGASLWDREDRYDLLLVMRRVGSVVVGRDRRRVALSGGGGDAEVVANERVEAGRTGSVRRAQLRVPGVLRQP